MPLMSARIDELFDTDYYAWTQAQVAALRRMDEARVNTELDLAHLLEEVESLGKSELRAVRSQIRRILEHLLKLEYSRAPEPRGLWRQSVIDGRHQLAERLTASLRDTIQADLEGLYTQAREKTADSLSFHREGDQAARLPATCPYSITEIGQVGWFPQNRHGL